MCRYTKRLEQGCANVPDRRGPRPKLHPTMTDGHETTTRGEPTAGVPTSGGDGGSCPECGDGSLTLDGDELVCEGCGLVLEERRLDPGPEWRAYDAAERAEKSRVGAPSTELLHDRGLSTTIGWRNQDAKGRPVSGRKRERLSRLRTWNERFRTRDSDDRNLKQALGEIDRMASALGLPDSVRETAGVVYRRALDEDLLPGRSIEGVASAALYAAARQQQLTRSLDEVANVSRVDRLEIERTYRYVADELSLSIPPTNPLEFVGRYASAVDCSEETERAARELIERAIDAGVHSGKHPVGIAASGIYAAAQLTDEGITQHALSDAANVSEVTIRNRYREILEATEAPNA